MVLLRYMMLTLAVLVLMVGAIASVEAQTPTAQQVAINSTLLIQLQKEVDDHQAKIEQLQVAMAVVKETSEQNNKILWGLLVGTVMMVVERAVGIANRRRKESDSDE